MNFDLNVVARNLASARRGASRPALRALGAVVLGLAVVSGCGGGGGSSSSSTGGVPTAMLSATTLSFSMQNVGSASIAQTIVVANTGTAPLDISAISIVGANAAAFIQTNTCYGSVAVAGQCAIAVVFDPAAAGALNASLNIADNASGSPQSVTLSGIGNPVAMPLATTVDCSVAAGLCPTLTFSGDPIASGGFHGYADPSMRKDPNSPNIYVAYSWAHTLADGTHTVDLHLSHSADGGATFAYDGPLYSTGSSTIQYLGSAYYTSTETVDLLPIAQGSSTLWVQAHQQYLVTPQADIYANLYTTNITSLTAVLVNPAITPPASLAAQLAAAPEARLGTASSNASRGITQDLAALSPLTAKCSAFGQQALAAVGSTLYLALECTETPGNGNIDVHEGSHFLYATTPVGADASQWVWSFVGEFATPAQAAQLGEVEGTAYNFFTELEFVQTGSGLAALITPAVFAPAGSAQPVIQYGCRVIPMTSLAIPAFAIDTTNGAPAVVAKVTESDLYSGTDEGPAACTYDRASTTGILMGRKHERDPTLGFIVTQLATGIKP